jgi:hypothetical protein
MRTNGPAEARVLDQTIASMEKSLARFHSDAALEELRDTIRAYRTPF